jgi:hypothetical protein
MNVLNSLKDLWTRWRHPSAHRDISPDYSYRLFWAKEALDWEAQERQQVREAVLEILEMENFKANSYQRRYSLEVVDDNKHAGASMLALYTVLQELDRLEQQEDLNDDTGR